MRNIIKIWPVILLVILLLNTPSIKGLTNVQLDRSISFQLVPGGELTVIGIGGGVPGALELPHQAENFGTLINNYSFDIELDIVVEVEFLEAEFDGNDPRWQQTRISVGNDRLNFGNISYNASKTLATDWINLEPGDELEVKLDGKSDFRVPGGSLHYALGVARFYITGRIPGGEELFYIEPGGDLLQQYFFKGNQGLANSVINYELNNETDLAAEEQHVVTHPLLMNEMLYPLRELYVVNLVGIIDNLQSDPEDIEAFEYWYEAEEQTEDTVLYLLFDDPRAKLSGTQTIKILARRTDNGMSIPELDIDLYQDGNFITTLATREEIDSTGGTAFIYTFDAGILDDLSGTNLELWLYGNNSGGISSQRSTVEFGAVSWLARYE